MIHFVTLVSMGREPGFLWKLRRDYYMSIFAGEEFIASISVSCYIMIASE